MPHPTAVYLICVADKKWITWHLLQTEPTYFGDSVFSSSPLRSHPTLMTAQREGDFCVVTWFDATKSSPLAAGAARVRLEHGGKFAFANREYAVWTQIEDAPWGEFSLLTRAQAMPALSSACWVPRVATSATRRTSLAERRNGLIRTALLTADIFHIRIPNRTINAFICSHVDI